MLSTRVTPNAKQVKVDVVGGSNFARYNKISAERTYNLFITTNGEKQGSEEYEEWIVNFPGYRRVLNVLPYPNPYPSNPPVYPSQVPAGSGRGFFNCTRGGFAILVVNSAVYRLSSTLNKILLGNISTSAGEVFIAENLNNQVCIVDGTNAYIYYYGNNAAPNLTIQNVAAGLDPSDPLVTGDLVPNYVEYHNTFFLFGNGNTANIGAAWYAYIPDTDTTIKEQTQFALQTKADFALAVKRIPGRGNNVLVLGSTVSEIWTQVGGLQNYIRQPSVNINYGCASVSTIAESDQMLAWLGINQDEAPVIMVYDGNTAQRISTDGIDYLLSQIKSPSTSTALFYRIDGHLFYQLTFYGPGDNLTLIYDFNTQMFFNLSDQYLNYHPARQIIYFNQKIYFISLNNAAIYEMSSNYTTIDENLYPLSETSPIDAGLVFEMQRMRITSSIRQGTSARFRVNYFVMTLEQGTDDEYSGIAANPNYHIITEAANNPPLTDTVTEGSVYYIVASNVPGIVDPYFNPNLPYTPHIDLSISLDGGITWSSYVRHDLNTLGNRKNILNWESLGMANDMCFKIREWSRSRTIWNNAIIDVIS